MKIYSNRADKNVDCIRTSMRTEKHNSLHVTLNFRRTVGVPVTMEDTWIALFEYVNGSYIPYIQCKDKEHALSYINVLERPSVPFDVI